MTTIDQELEDIANDAMNADTRPQRPFRIFGEVVTLDMWRCVLETGRGKIPFDPQVHQSFRMRNSITIEVQRISDGRIFKREWLDGDNRNDKGWTKITLPSLKANNIHLTTILGRFVTVETVPTGRTWTNDKKEEIQETTFKFIETFATRDSCEAAELIYYGTPADEAHANVANAATSDDSDPFAEDLPSPPAATNSDHNIGIQAAKALWTASGKDETKFRKMLAGNPSVLKHFANGASEALEAVSST